MMASKAVQDDADEALRTLLLTPAAVNAWANAARPGDELIYARAGILPLHAHGPLAARALYDEGRVELFQRRAGPGLFDYVARRRTQTNRRGAPKLVGAGAIKAESGETRLFDLLDRAARRGEPCPPNAKLASGAGLLNADQASYMLRKLQAARRIAVATDADGRRVVTIVSTGRRTG